MPDKRKSRQMLGTHANGFGRCSRRSHLLRHASPSPGCGQPVGRRPPPRSMTGKPLSAGRADRERGRSGRSSCSCPAAVARRPARPKPRLADYHGSRCRSSLPKLVRTPTVNALPSPFKFKQHGECGTAVSELFPEVATCVDDLCVVRSMYADNINHNGLPPDEHRRAGVQPPEPRLVAALRAGEREPEPARRRHQPRPAGTGRAAVEQQLPAAWRTRGHSSPTSPT